MAQEKVYSMRMHVGEIVGKGEQRGGLGLVLLTNLIPQGRVFLKRFWGVYPLARSSQNDTG